MAFLAFGRSSLSSTIPVDNLTVRKQNSPREANIFFFSRRRDGVRTDGQTRVRRRELLKADGARLGEDLKCANEDGAVGGGWGCRPQHVAAGEVAGYGQEAPETAHAGWIGDERMERQVREPDDSAETGRDRETR
jgi:hypothetical protein